ncbi:response regulator transcription factor [Actinoplanes sp. NBRC 103695]|uniref:LuxR C-terminal-related transcriptional regulator n=1 Tax=Actinoplanes sp. NBRC 103695 TaxID=3032202 RepID=UPI0024A45CEB|nr:response regulator transcription factor [Actinoplanes sp. NBRC 103695]GLY93247.1 hypothetical protein Acsp02_05030 [Actinoplanes sp. NBRC 103695]
MLRWLVGVATAVPVAGGFVLGPHLGNLHNGLIAASFTAVGMYVVRRRPGNREGRLFVAVGVAHAVMFAGREYGLHAGPLPGASWVAWFGVWPLPLVLVLIGVTVMCFPTGRLPSRGWVPVVVVLAAAGLVLATVSALWPVEYARIGLVAGHPFDLPGTAAAEAFYRVARPVGYLLFQLTWVACVVVRVRRARGDEARQMRWFLYAVTVSAAVMLLGLAVGKSPVPGTLTAPLLAVAAGAAILRYRLYDIDPVINKSLVLGAMAAVVTAGYAVMARVLTDIGFTVTGQAGDGAALLSLVRADPPDVSVIDLRMPPGFAAEGIDTAAAPGVGLMLLSQYVEVHHALRLMTEFDGGVGYLLKDRVSDLAAFGTDVRRVARGETVIDPDLVSRLVARRRERDPLDALTVRERAVLALMAQGLSNAAVAADLHLAIKTVEAHVTSIFTKLGLIQHEREHRRVRAVLTFLRA